MSCAAPSAPTARCAPALIISAETDHSERNERQWYRSTGLSAAAMVERARWQLDAWVNSAGAHRRCHHAASGAGRGSQRRRRAAGPVGWAHPGRRVGGACRCPAGHVGRRRARPRPRCHGWPAAGRCLCVGACGHRRSRRTGATPHPARWAVAGQPAQPVTGGGARRAAARSTSATSMDGRCGSPAGEQSVQLPAAVQRAGTATELVVAWAGPWPLEERWWDATRARRSARFQLLTASGSLLLVCLERQQWWLVGDYR